MKYANKSLKQIVEIILQLTEKEQHPDWVSCIHAVLMQVNMMVGEEMFKIGEMEKIV